MESKLAVISVMLGILAVYQSWKYKNLGDQITSYQNEILAKLKEKSDEMFIFTRNINDKVVPSSNLINLHKDKVNIRIGYNFKPSNIDQLVQKLDEELPSIFKTVYIEKIKAYLIKEDNYKDGIIETTLRCRFNLQNYKKLVKLNLNQKFKNDGISFKFEVI